MVEMKSGEVVLSLAAQLASWWAVLVQLVRTWATCKPWQRRDFHQHSIILADCLHQSKQTVWELAGAAAAATESRKAVKDRRKRRYADVDGPGANPEPELGPRGPTLKKQVLKGYNRLDMLPILQPGVWETCADFYIDEGGNNEWEEELWSLDWDCQSNADFSEAMDPAGSPSPILKVADTARPSASSSTAALPVPSWWSFSCFGNGK